MSSIQHHIATAGITREEICKRADLSRSMLSMIERGTRRPGPKLAAKLAEVLGVAPADIRPDLAAFAARPRPDDERPLVGATPDTDPRSVTK